MRMIRTVLAAFVAAVLVLGVGAVALAPAGASSAPKRVIDEEPPSENKVSFNAFRLKGNITQPLPDGTFARYVDGPVKLQKKTCQKCRWKVVKTMKTNQYGTFKTRIYTPRTGRWKWRVKVPASDGYATTKGKVWTTYFRRS